MSDGSLASSGGSSCPLREVLLAWVGSGEPGGEVASHVATCAACGRAAEEQREDIRFAVRFAAMVRSRPGDPAPHASGVVAEQGLPSVPGYTIGPEITRGGQGVVYRGIQHETNRAVAIKTILRGVLASQREIARFEREVEIAASLRHPNIVTVFEARHLVDGRHVLAMEFIDGVPLTQWAGARREVTFRERIELMIKVARAVQYAHGRGVIHRDLKPGNILVDKEGQPHVLDFGLARRGPLIDVSSGVRPIPAPNRADQPQADQSMQGVFQGTPAYAAPEQFEIDDTTRLDVRADIYSLGVIMHELIVGDTPFLESKGDLFQIAKIKRTAILRTGAGRDLDAVVARATNPSRDARYESAGQLADELDAVLRGTGVWARRGEPLYRLRKVIGRHRGLVGGALAGAAALIGFVTITVRHNQRLASEQVRLEAVVREAIVAHATTLLRDGSRQQAEELLWSQVLSTDSIGVELPSWNVAIGESGWAKRLAWKLAEMQVRGVCAAAMPLAEIGRIASVDDKSVVVYFADGYLRAYDAANLRQVGDPRRIGKPRDIRAADARGGRVVFDDGERLTCVSLATGERTTRDIREFVPRFIQISEKGGYAFLQASRTQWRVIKLPEMIDVSGPMWPTEQNGVLFHPNDKEVMIYNTEGRLTTFSLPRAEPIPTRFIWTRALAAVVEETDARPGFAIDASGELLGVSVGRAAIVMSTGAGLLATKRGVSYGESISLYFDPTRRWVSAFASGDSDVRVLRVQDLEQAASFDAQIVYSRAYSPDGTCLYTISGPQGVSIRKWEMPDHSWRRILPESEIKNNVAAFSPDGSLWILGARGGGLTRYSGLAQDAAAETEASYLREQSAVAFVKRGEEGQITTLIGGQEGDILLYQKGPKEGLSDRLPMPEGSFVEAIATSPDGAMVVAATAQSLVRLWKTADWSVVATRDLGVGRISSIAWSPDSKSFAYTSPNIVRSLSASDLSDVDECPQFKERVRGVVSLDAARVVTFGADRRIRIWKRPTVGYSGSPRWELVKDQAKGPVDSFTAAVHPSGRLFAVGDRGGAVQIIDADEDVVLATFSTMPAAIMSLAFTPDGRGLVVCHISGIGAELWDLKRLLDATNSTSGYWRQHIRELKASDSD